MSSDLQFPLTPDLQLVHDEQVTIQNVKQLFFTNPLEDIYFPTLGIGIEGYVFENGVDLFSTLQQPIIDQIRKYVPEFQEIFLDVKQLEDNIEITLTGSILKYGIGQISFTLESI